MTALSVSTIVEALGIVGLNCNSLDLRAGAAANVKGRSNLALLTRSNLLVLRLRRGTTARGVDGLKMNRRIPDIFIFEMCDRLLVVKRRAQINRRLFPLQLCARALGERS